MAGKPIGAVAMSAAERQRRRRAKARALRDATPAPADSDAVVVTANARGSEPTGFTAEPVPALDTDAIAALPTESSGNPGPDDYPRMLYQEDGRTIIVETSEEHDRLMAGGWSMTPFDVHRQRPVTHFGFLGASNVHPLAATLRDVMRSVLDEYDLSDFVAPEVSKRFRKI
jgi:hypothetical protein